MHKCSFLHSEHFQVNLFVFVCLLLLACVFIDCLFIWLCAVVFSLTCSSALWHAAWPRSEHPVSQQSFLTFDLCAALHALHQSDSHVLSKRLKEFYLLQITKKHQANKISCFRPIWPAEHVYPRVLKICWGNRTPPQWFSFCSLISGGLVLSRSACTARALKAH